MAIGQFNKITYDDINNLKNTSIETGTLKTTGDITCGGNVTANMYYGSFSKESKFKMEQTNVAQYDYYEGQVFYIKSIHIESTAYVNSPIVFTFCSRDWIKQLFFQTSGSSDISTMSVKTFTINNLTTDTSKPFYYVSLGNGKYDIYVYKTTYNHISLNNVLQCQSYGYDVTVYTINGDSNSYWNKPSGAVQAS